MHRNPIWLSFLSGIILLTLFFSYQAVEKSWVWGNYNQKMEVRVLSWEIIQNKSGDLEPELRYILPSETENKIITSRYKNKRFRNEWAANQFLDSVKNISTWTVWIRPDYFDSAMLERNFPWKSVIYASLLLGLTIYFFWLGAYVVKLQSKD